MNINDWTRLNYPSLLQASKNITKNNDLSEELLHFCFEKLLEKDNLQDILDSGGANFYLVRIMMNNWKSTTSPFYRIYRNPASSEELINVCDEQEIDEEDHEELIEGIQMDLKKLHWYEQTLFKIYVDENHSISSLSRATGIPRTSISLSINRVRKYILDGINKKE